MRSGIMSAIAAVPRRLPVAAVRRRVRAKVGVVLRVEALMPVAAEALMPRVARGGEGEEGEGTVRGLEKRE